MVEGALLSTQFQAQKGPYLIDPKSIEAFTYLRPSASSSSDARMLVSPRLLTNGSGLVGLASSLGRIQRQNGSGHSSFKFSSSMNGRVSYNKKKEGGFGAVVSVGFARQSYNEEDPLWLSLVRDIVWSTRSLFSFMAEQPSQLKYIEWPSFTTTLKTATLSLCLVAIFIVALSSVDSALCYILALILRKAP